MGNELWCRRLSPYEHGGFRRTRRLYVHRSATHLQRSAPIGADRADARRSQPVQGASNLVASRWRSRTVRHERPRAVRRLCFGKRVRLDPTAPNGFDGTTSYLPVLDFPTFSDIATGIN